MNKAGVVFQKDIVEYFNPYDRAHACAYFRWKITGLWPDGFLGSNIFLSHGYEKVLEEAMDKVLIPHDIKSYAEELERVRGIVADIECSGYDFIVEPIELDKFAIRIQYREADVVTGQLELQRGRPLLLNLGETTGQIVQAAFRCLMASTEHRNREWFRYRGRQVMGPHRDFDALFTGDFAHNEN